MERYKRPSDTVIAYTTGLIDGEGWISYNERLVTAVVGVTQSEQNNGERLANWFLEQWSVGRIMRYERVTNLGIHSVMWHWEVHRRRDVAFVLECCLPYFIVKPGKAIEVLDFIARTPTKYTRWSEIEKQYIRDNWRTKSVQEIADFLGRDKDAVQKQGTLYGLSRPGGKGWRTLEFAWSDEHVTYLREHWHTHTWREIGNELGIREQSVGRMARKLGFTGDKRALSSRLRDRRRGETLPFNDPSPELGDDPLPDTAS